MNEKPQRDVKKYLLGGVVSTALLVALFFYGGQVIADALFRLIGTPLVKAISPFFDAAGLNSFNTYFYFIFLWIPLVLVLLVVKPWRRYLRVLGTKPCGNRPKLLFIGLGVGLLLNTLCILVAVLCGNIAGFEFVGFQPLYVLVFIVIVFIQSSYEEMLYRGFAFQRIQRVYGPAVAVVANSLFFAAGHLNNPGMGVVPFLAIVSAGILFSFGVRYFDSLWMSFGIHTGWNFCQAVLFGLPNSGIEAGFAIFKPVGEITESFAWNSAFGIEGTIVAVLALLTTAGIMVAWGRKHPRPCFSVFDDDVSAAQGEVPGDAADEAAIEAMDEAPCENQGEVSSEQ